MAFACGCDDRKTTRTKPAAPAIANLRRRPFLPRGAAAGVSLVMASRDRCRRYIAPYATLANHARQRARAGFTPAFSASAIVLIKRRSPSSLQHLRRGAGSSAIHQTVSSATSGHSWNPIWQEDPQYKLDPSLFADPYVRTASSTGQSTRGNTLRSRRFRTWQCSHTQTQLRPDDQASALKNGRLSSGVILNVDVINQTGNGFQF